MWRPAIFDDLINYFFKSGAIHILVPFVKFVDISTKAGRIDNPTDTERAVNSKHFSLFVGRYKYTNFRFVDLASYVGCRLNNTLSYTILDYIESGEVGQFGRPAITAK